jgi:AraC-like DNA-binding protein
MCLSPCYEMAFPMCRTAPADTGDLRPTELTSSRGAAVTEPEASFKMVDEIDGYTRSVAGVQVEAVRCGPSVGPSRVLTVQDEGLTFTSSNVGFPLRTRTTIRDDQVVLGAVLEAPLGSRWCEFDLRAGTVLVYGPGAEHTGISLPGLHFEFAAVTVDRIAELAALIESPLELPARGQVQELTTAPNAGEVVSSMSELAEAATSGGVALRRASDAVLDAVVLALVDRPVPARANCRISSRHVVHQCMDYANDVGRIPSMSELCLAGHVSERRLRKAFVDEFDVPPSTFFRDWALTLARERLRSADGDRPTVTDIAFNLGFGHLGRFSAHYRQLHGEAPSTTRRSSLQAS